EPWQVVLHWLVASPLQARWSEQISDFRRQTALPDSLALDALILAEGELEPQLAAHEFPRLLLTTREVLSKPQSPEVAQWLSADPLVLQALEDFSLDFQ